MCVCIIIYIIYIDILLYGINTYDKRNSRLAYIFQS